MNSSMDNEDFQIPQLKGAEDKLSDQSDSDVSLNFEEEGANEAMRMRQRTNRNKDPYYTKKTKGKYEKIQVLYQQ